MLIAVYILWNTFPGTVHFDPYPFILLNLFMSFQASFLGPVILMAQNHQEDKDRELLYNGFELSKATEAQIRELVDIVRTNDNDIGKILDTLQAKLPTRKV